VQTPSKSQLSPSKKIAPKVGDKVMYDGKVQEVLEVSEAKGTGVKMVLEVNGQKTNASSVDWVYKGIVPKDTPAVRMHVSQTEVKQGKQKLANSILSFFSNMDGVAGNIVADVSQMVDRLNSLGYVTMEAYA